MRQRFQRLLLSVASCSALFWMSASPALADVPDADKKTDAAPDAHAGTAPGNFSKSIILPRDRTLERDLQTIVSAIATENWSSIAQVLNHLITVLAKATTDTGGTNLVELDGVVCSINVAISRVFNRLPLAGQSVVLRLVEPIARNELTTAMKRQDVAGLQQVARRYRFTESGQQARELYQAIQRDVGRYSPSAEQAPLGNRFPTFTEKGWTRSTETPELTQQALNSAYRYLRQSGVTPYPTANFTSGENVLLASLANERLALDPLTGEVKWSRPVAGYGASWYQSPGNLGDRNRARLFSIAVTRRVFGESVFARTAVDGTRCYFLEMITEQPEGSSSSKNGDGTPKDGDETMAESEFYNPFPANRLVCVDQRTGETLWTQPPASEKKVFFAGTPQAAEGIIWILGESRETKSLTLYQYDAVTGKQLESQEIAQAKLSISEDNRRQEIDCQVIVDQDLIICPTAAGALFAIDRLTGDMLWGHRLPRKDAIDFPPDFEMPSHRPGFNNWDGWQGMQLLMAGDLLVCASPEQRELLVLDKQTGQRVWSVFCEDGQTIASAEFLYGVVVIGKSSATAYSLKGGDRGWSTPIPQPAGRGTIAPTASGRLCYLFPILEEGYASIDLKSGLVTVDLASAYQAGGSEETLPVKMRPRNLSKIGSQPYLIAPDEIVQIPSHIEYLIQPESFTTANELKRLIQDGEINEAFERLQHALKGTGDRQNSRQSMVAQLAQELLHKKNREQQLELIKKIAELPLDVHERAFLRLKEGVAASLNKDYVAFAEAWLEASEEEMNTFLPTSDQTHRFRLDRWFQQQFNELPRSEVDHASDAVLEVLKRPRGANVPVTNRELARRFGPTRIKWSALTSTQTEPATLQELLETELQLKLIADSFSPADASHAAYRLFQINDRRGFTLDAARWMNVLGRFPSDFELPDGKTIGQVCSTRIPQLQKTIDSAPLLEPWPNVDPRMDARQRPSREVYLVPLTVPNFMESGFERLAVQLDYPARQAVRFSGSAWPRPWYCPLPQELRSVRLDEHLDRCWALEHLLIVQSGMNLFGVTPFDLQGKPRGQLLWPKAPNKVSTLGERGQFIHTTFNETRPDRPGFPSPATRQLDEFLHPLADVGPVRSGYLCYQQMGMLVAIDPANGEEMWRRYDLPARAHCYGDDRELAVISPETDKIHFYSAIDGRRLRTEPRTHHPDDVVAVHQLDLILVQGDRHRIPLDEEEMDASSIEDQKKSETQPEVTLSRLNLATGKTLWKRSWDGGSIPFEIDEFWMGILTPSKQIELFDLSNGKTVSNHPLISESPVERIYCSVLDTDLLLMFSSAIEHQRMLQSEQIRGGFRRPWVKGTLLCIDRETGGEKWSMQLDQTELPLDQTPELPVFVTAQRRGPTFDTEEEETDLPPKTELPPGTILRCYDRRNGKLLHEIFNADETLPSYTIVGQRSTKRIQIQTLQTRLEINYAP